MIYTAYAIAPWKGPLHQDVDEIETYDDLDDAIMDVLGMWLEDESDVEIVDESGRTVAVMVRGTDPKACHVMQAGRPTETYRVRYESGEDSALVRSKIERLI